MMPAMQMPAMSTMPSMNMNMMPMAMMCSMTCTTTATGMTCNMMPMESTSKEMFKKWCETMTQMMDAGMPMMMTCGCMTLCCCSPSASFCMPSANMLGMPMMAKMSCKMMDNGCMTCEMMPMDGMNTQMFTECCTMLNQMCCMGMPMMMTCGGMTMCCCMKK